MQESFTLIQSNFPPRSKDKAFNIHDRIIINQTLNCYNFNAVATRMKIDLNMNIPDEFHNLAEIYGTEGYDKILKLSNLMRGN